MNKLTILSALLVICASLQASDQAYADGNYREAAELYIEDCVEHGDPVPEEAGREYIELQTAP